MTYDAYLLASSYQNQRKGFIEDKIRLQRAQNARGSARLIIGDDDFTISSTEASEIIARKLAEVNVSITQIDEAFAKL